MAQQFRSRPPRNKSSEKTDDPVGSSKDKTLEQVYAEVERLRQDADEILRQIDAVLKKSERSEIPMMPLGGPLRRKLNLEVTDSRQAPPGGRHRNRGGGNEDDFDRVVKILESIRETLELLVKSKCPVPPELWEPIIKSWPIANEGLQKAKAVLQTATPSPKYRRLLINAGFVGAMLDLKEGSVVFHKSRMKKAVLTYNQNESLAEKVAKWLKPGFKVMNSILGSLSGIPGVEVAKEFKDHLESGYEVIEVGQPE